MNFKFEYDGKTGLARIIFTIDGKDYILPLEESIIKRWFHID